MVVTRMFCRRDMPRLALTGRGLIIMFIRLMVWRWRPFGKGHGSGYRNCNGRRRNEGRKELIV